MPELIFYDPLDHWPRPGGYKVVEAASPAAIVTPALTVADISNEISFVGRLQGPITRVSILSHGAPGLVYLRDNPLTVANAALLQPACQTNMARGAQVFLYGCNVAQGPRGVAFLTTLAQAMVGALGGLVLAVTSVTFSARIVGGEWLPPWGTVVAAKAGPGGPVTITYH
jgi:hypothetical protein